MGLFEQDHIRLSKSEKVGKGIATYNFDITMYMQTSLLLGKKYVVKVEQGVYTRYKSKQLKTKKEAEAVFETKKNQVLDVLKGTKTLKDLKK